MPVFIEYLNRHKRQWIVAEDFFLGHELVRKLGCVQRVLDANGYFTTNAGEIDGFPAMSTVGAKNILERAGRGDQFDPLTLMVARSVVGGYPEHGSMAALEAAAAARIAELEREVAIRDRAWELFSEIALKDDCPDSVGLGCIADVGNADCSSIGGTITDCWKTLCLRAARAELARDQQVADAD